MHIRPGIELGNLTDVGCHRPENEDYYCYAEPEDEQEFLHKGRLAVVADGMGGHEGGEMASRIAVECVRDAYLAYPDGDPRENLIAAFHQAHSAIQQYAREHPELEGMGTTCTCAVLKNNQLYYGHIGDSRLYLIRNPAISLVTEDHSYVQRLVRQGMLTPEQAAVHPERNILTAALGTQSAVAADFSQEPMPLAPGDVLLLCTDGLHGLVSDRELLYSACTSPAGEACRELVQTAKNRGGFDNITVQILRIL
ncbi:MAG TPA: Stp1/IreP family PP2C-type Ser/Thr phosphatase [Bryobacteraceae bacterium]|nr:Stp1/IreP family PP2C-type Ser/Thr phosphatase [Bryobacteraceae bacterium]